MKFIKKNIISIILTVVLTFVATIVTQTIMNNDSLPISSEIEIALDPESHSYYKITDLMFAKDIDEVYVTKDHDGDYLLASKGDTNSFLIKELNSAEFILDQVYVTEKDAGDYKVSLRSLRKNLIKVSDLIVNKSDLPKLGVYKQKGSLYLIGASVENDEASIGSIIGSNNVAEVFVEEVGDQEYLIKGIKVNTELNKKL